jgi:hypothetical protein
LGVTVTGVPNAVPFHREAYKGSDPVPPPQTTTGTLLAPTAIRGRSLPYVLPLATVISEVQLSVCAEQFNEIEMTTIREYSFFMGNGLVLLKYMAMQTRSQLMTIITLFQRNYVQGVSYIWLRMKRVFVFIFLVFYSFAATGASVRFHFCGEHLIDYSVFPGDRADCCCSKKRDCKPEHAPGFSKPCCVEHITSLNIEDDQSVYSISEIHLYNYTSILVSPADVLIAPSGYTLVVADFNRPPPLNRGQVFLFVRNLRI